MIYVLTAEPLGEDILETLDAVRERAERGELSSVAISYVLRDGTTGQQWSSAPSLGLLLGSAQLLVHRLAKSLLGDEE